jgi:excisionase family DNA binding protein
MPEDGLTLAATVPSVALGPFEERITEAVLIRLESNTSPWMNIDAAATYLDFPKKRLYNLVAANEIPHRKQSNRLLFNRTELDKWLNAHYQGPAEFVP